ncbi:MAG: sigma-54-dependent Fis family transcriptional regulator, partial [Alphaproteobacteria bacterium]
MEPDRMEAELFGVECDGGVEKTGLFERAHGGTLFIDEVADMPRPTQAKILRVLTDQTFERVGSASQVQVDVRVVSATSRDLRREIARGAFREDLFHRLAVVPIEMPSLSERREDIPLLVDHFMKTLAIATGRPPRPFSEAAMAALQAYDWPGNVRQLRNVIERLLIMSAGGGEPVEVDSLPPELVDGSAELLRPDSNLAIMAAPLREAREAFEREYLRIQITRFSGNISRTAHFVGMERSALHRKLKSLGITPGSARGN